MKFGHLVFVAALAFTLPASSTVFVQPLMATAAESYKLPITPPLDQGESGLCWIYSTLSMLETNYLAQHPNSTIRLSRAAVQRASILDRFQRHITGNSTHFEDGGVPVDALRLIAQQGLVSADDAGDIVDNSTPIFTAVSAEIEGPGEPDAKLKTLDSALSARLPPPPGRTRLDGQALTPEDLAKAVLGDRVWTEYDLAPAGSPQLGRSTDPDARPETMVHYIKQAEAIRLIHDSLKRGEAVVWGSTDNHALLIYGADYDAQGKPLDYWVKDSFAPYTRRMEADEVHATLTDVTVAADAEAAQSATN